MDGWIEWQETTLTLRKVDACTEPVHVYIQVG
jgi:hypothetical protein